MSPHKTKRENFIRAVARLDDAVQDYQQYHMEASVYKGYKQD